MGTLPPSELLIQRQQRPSSHKSTKDVFIVHGHEDIPKITLSNFLYKLGLNPIILHGQPNKGRTIIEKFEQHASSATYAFVLLTPDDVGSEKHHPNPKPRARQNVILELGFFMAMLGRDRVCAVYTQNVEIPSDYQGVAYLSYQNTIEECFPNITRVTGCRL